MSPSTGSGSPSTPTALPTADDSSNGRTTDHHPPLKVGSNLLSSPTHNICPRRVQQPCDRWGVAAGDAHGCHHNYLQDPSTRVVKRTVDPSTDPRRSHPRRPRPLTFASLACTRRPQASLVSGRRRRIGDAKEAVGRRVHAKEPNHPHNPITFADDFKTPRPPTTRVRSTRFKAPSTIGPSEYHRP